MVPIAKKLCTKFQSKFLVKRPIHGVTDIFIISASYMTKSLKLSFVDILIFLDIYLLQPKLILEKKYSLN